MLFLLVSSTSGWFDVVLSCFGEVSHVPHSVSVQVRTSESNIFKQFQIALVSKVTFENIVPDERICVAINDDTFKIVVTNIQKR